MMLNRAKHKVCMQKEANQFLLIIYKCEEKDEFKDKYFSYLKRHKLCMCYSWAETCMRKTSQSF